MSQYLLEPLNKAYQKFGISIGQDGRTVGWFFSRK